MRIIAFVTIAGLAIGSTAPLHGQSLADAAKAETERRQGVKKGGAKVYTNGDLKTVDPSPDPSGAAAGDSHYGKRSCKPSRFTQAASASVEAARRPYSADSAGLQDTGQAAPAHRPSVDLGQRQRSFGAHAMFSRT